MANEFIVRNGLIAKASSIISGSLEITGAVTGSGAGLTNIPSAGLTPPGSDTQILFNSDGSLAANSGLVYSGSKLGVGITSPTWEFEVKGGIVTEDDLTTGRMLIRQVDQHVAEFVISPSDDSPSNYFQFRPNSQGADAGLRVYDRYETDYVFLRHDGGNGYIGTKSSAQAGNLNIQTAGITALTIQSGSNNVGIGTASPDARLEVNTDSTSDVAINANERLKILGNGTMSWGASNDYGQLSWDTGYALYRGQSNKGIKLQVNSSSTVMTLTTGSNVGIGTTDPVGPLEVAGNTDTNSNFLVITDEDTTAGSSRPSVRFRDQNTQIGQIVALDIDSGKLRFSAGSTEDSMLEIRSSGNVGIGTTEPSAKLHVSGTSDVLLVEGSGSTIFDVQGSQGQLFSVTDSLVGSLFSVNDISGLPIIEVFDTDKVVMGTFGQNTLVVTGSLVGIGTVTPNRPLTIETNTTDVVGALKVKNAGTGDASMFFQVNASGNVWQLGIDNSDGDKFKIGQDNSNADVGVGTKLTIDTSGNVGIGTASPSQKLHVDGNALVNNLYLSNTTTRLSTNGSGEVGIDYNNSATSTYGLSVYNGSTTRVFGVKRATGDVEMNGDLTVGGIVTAQEFHTEFVSASIIYQSGSTQFGDTSDDEHDFTGTVNVAGNNTAFRVYNLNSNGSDTGIEIRGARNGAVGTATSYIAFTNNDDNNGGQHALGRIYGAMASTSGNDGTLTLQSWNGSTYSTGIHINEDGNVGVGTFNTVNKFGVNGTAQIGSNGTANAFGRFQVNQTANNDESGIGILSSGSARSMRLWVDETISYISSGDGGAGILTLNEGGGNVGIGTTAPASTLEVKAPSTNSGTEVKITNNFGESRKTLSFDYENSSNGVNDTVGRIEVYGRPSTVGGPYMQFKVHDGTSLNEAIRISGSGAVGIGTTAPKATLDVAGNSNEGIRIAENNALLGATSGGAGADTQLLYWNGTHAYYGRYTTGYTGKVMSHSFRANGSTMLYVTSSGVHIGSTTGTDAPLLVKSNGSSADQISLEHSGNTVKLVSLGQLNSHGSVVIRQNSGVEKIRLHSSASSYINTGFNFGIGTASPSKALHVLDANDAPIRVESTDGTTGIQFKDPGGDNSLYYVGSGDYFYTTANFGIGTTNPSYKLEVVGHVSASAFSGSFKGDGSGLTDVTAVISLAEVLGTGNDAGGNDIDNVGALTAGAITATSEISGSIIRSATSASFGGPVGIGTTSPDSKLHVVGSNVSVGNQPSILAKFENATDGRNLVRVQNTNTNTGASALATGFSMVALSSNSNEPESNTHEAQLILRSDTSGNSGRLQMIAPKDIDFRVDATDTVMTGSAHASVGTGAMFISQSGNVGIGTTSIPTAKLQVAGIISGSKLDLPRGGYITFYGDDDGTGDHSISARDANGNASDDLRINSFHNVYVNLDSNNNNSSNTTSFSISQHGGTGTLGSSLFSVRGDGLTTVTGDLTVTGALNATASYATNLVNIPSLAEVLNSGEDGGGFNILDIASIEASGTVTAGTFVETSARRFKENIELISNSLEILSKIEGITFNRIGEERREYGFIADDILDVAPELVSHDENGEVHGVHYARTVAILTEAVKELDNKVKAQDLFIKDLVARIEKLENK